MTTAVNTQPAAKEEKSNALTDAIFSLDVAPQSALASSSIFAGAGIERSESINFPNADARLVLETMSKLTKKALSAVKSVIDHDPLITVSRSQQIFQGRMWSAVDAIKEQVGKIAGQLETIKESHGKIELSNVNTRDQNTAAAQTINEVKNLAQELSGVLGSIANDRQEIIQIEKESNLKEPNFLGKLASCTRTVEAFLAAIATDVGTVGSSVPGKAEKYLANLVEHIDSLDDAKASISPIGADSKLGQVKRDLAIEYADQFAQKSGAFDTISISTDNFLNDEDILALYDLRTAPKSTPVEVAATTEVEPGIAPSFEHEIGSEGNSSVEINTAPEKISSSVGPMEDSEDALSSEEASAGETAIAGASATRIEGENTEAERALPVRTLEGLPANPDDMSGKGSEQSGKYPRVSEDFIREATLLSEVHQHLDALGWDKKESQFQSIMSQRSDVLKKLNDARELIVKSLKQSIWNRVTGATKSFFSAEADAVGRARNFITKNIEVFISLGADQSKLSKEFIPEIRQKFAGQTFELTEENKSSIPAPLLYAAVPFHYRNRMLGFDDLSSKVESLVRENKKYGGYCFKEEDANPKRFSVLRYGMDGENNTRLEFVHYREGKAALFIDRQDGTGKQYLGSIWTPQGTRAVTNFLEYNDEAFSKRTEKFYGTYYIPEQKES